MTVSPWLWAATIVGLIAVIVVDLVIVDRRPHAFRIREATTWVCVYVSLAAVFAIFLWWAFSGTWSLQFVTGYLTEYSLSVDNLFVFMVIMGSFAVPESYQHRVLLVGVVIALILRGILILIGSELINRFTWVFFIFAAFLLFTAVQVWTGHDKEPHPEGNALVRLIARRVPSSPAYAGTRLTTRIDGRRVITPMALVMVAIGTTDLLFAVDSIPAVFGITQEPYLVFAANAFALMGLRQLFFLLKGVLGRLRYLSKGLAVILAFIGVKLALEAVHGVFGVSVPEIPSWLSLLVIVLVLLAVILASARRIEDDEAPGSISP